MYIYGVGVVCTCKYLIQPHIMLNNNNRVLVCLYGYNFREGSSALSFLVVNKIIFSYFLNYYIENYMLLSFRISEFPTFCFSN